MAWPSRPGSYHTQQHVDPQRAAEGRAMAEMGEQGLSSEAPAWRSALWPPPAAREENGPNCAGLVGRQKFRYT